MTRDEEQDGDEEGGDDEADERSAEVTDVLGKRRVGCGLDADEETDADREH
jgi:hypothetical protein